MPDYQLYQMRPHNPAPDVMKAMLDCRFGQPDAALALELHRYTGTILATDLNEFFLETNSIDAAWIQNASVRHLADDCRNGAPSCSVGDIAVDPATEGAWICASMGWDPLQEEFADKLVAEAAMRAWKAEDAPSP